MGWYFCAGESQEWFFEAKLEELLIESDIPFDSAPTWMVSGGENKMAAIFLRATL